MPKSRELDGEKLARSHQSLPIGTQVAIQNQSGRNPTKWDKTGVLVKIRPHKQVVVKLRNRRFIQDPRKTCLEVQLTAPGQPVAPVARTQSHLGSRRRATPSPAAQLEFPGNHPLGLILMDPMTTLGMSLVPSKKWLGAETTHNPQRNLFQVSDLIVGFPTVTTDLSGRGLPTPSIPVTFTTSTPSECGARRV
jgi:hypothetical protein